MAIESLSQAFAILDTQKEGIPFEAIRYLRKCPTSQALTEKIIYALNHAYDDTYYNESEDYNYSTPLWYAIVAEQHLSTDLVGPVIRLFTTTEDTWDFLDEQGEFLLGQLTQRYGDVVIEAVMAAIDREIEKKSNNSYLYLFDVFYFANSEKYKDWFLKTLADKDLCWTAVFAYQVAHLQIQEAIPILEKLITKAARDKKSFISDEADFREALAELEGEAIHSPEFSRPHCLTRKSWEAHFKQFEGSFYDKEEDDGVDDERCDENEFQSEPIRVVKIGRNEKCICGSDKKYKRCHGA